VDELTSSTLAYDAWKSEFEKLLSKCFRKVTRKEKTEVIESKIAKKVRCILSEIRKRGKIQREVVAKYLVKLVLVESSKIAKATSERVKSTMSQLTSDEKFSPTGYWKMKKAVKKGTRKTNNISSVINKNGAEVDGEIAVREAYKDEFEKRLSNREAAKEWKEYVVETNRAVRNWLAVHDVSSIPDFKLEELKKVIAQLKNEKAPGVDGYPAELFKYAGEGVLNSLLKLFNLIKATKEIPDQWDVVKIVTIYKQKGSKKVLKYYRGIFLTLVISKIFEKLLKERIEDKLTRVNLLQAGSRRNRGGPDNTFLFRACVDHHMFTKKPLFITAYDFEQAFDSLWLEDCVLSLQKLGIEKEYLQLIYNMNKRAVVTVQTPRGETSSFVTDPIVKQGTVLGPVLCSSMTGEYCDTNVGACMGTINIPSLLYVDDIIDMTTSTEDCESAHESAILFGKKKKIRYSGTKCFNMVLNQKDDKQPCLVIDENSSVLPSDEIVYLGDVFNHLGNNDGLIADRIKRGTKAMITIMALMAETDVGIYKISTMLLLYSSLFLSTMLFNSQTWSKIRVKQWDQLRTMQLKFLKRILGVASSTCNSFVFLELGILPIEYEVDKRKLMYLHRILNLEESDPVYITFRNMMSFAKAGEENWWSEIEAALEKYNLPTDLDEVKELTKDKFKEKVNEAVTGFAFTSLVTECQSLRKTANISYKSFKVQEYLTTMYPNQSKVVFKCRSQTLDIKAHLTYKYKDKLCRRCETAPEEVGHIVNCGHASTVAVADYMDIEGWSDQSKVEIRLMVSRITSFLEEIENGKNIEGSGSHPSAPVICPVGGDASEGD
jgi:hypothetical protein